MIDLLNLEIPFANAHCTESSTQEGVYYIDLQDVAKHTGLKMQAGDVTFEFEPLEGAEEIDGVMQGTYKPLVSTLRHPWDSVPSSFSGIAMKIHVGGQFRFPCVQLKCSPAKILQGHNIFGSCDLEMCSLEMLAALWQAQPLLAEMLDIPNTQLAWIDCTFSARAPDNHVAQQVINALKNIRYGGIRPARKSDMYDTTVYWNENSRHVERKAYLKDNEFTDDFEALKKKVQKIPKEKVFLPKNKQLIARYKALEPIACELLNYARGLIRFEARVKQRYLQDFGVPRGLMEAIQFQKKYEFSGRSLIFDLWHKAFKDLFKCFEGASMNIYNDDEVRQKLESKFYTITKSGNKSFAKALRLFGLYRRFINEGFETVKATMPKQSVSRHLADFAEAGISRAQLQQCIGDKSQTNVIPLIRIIDVRFDNQIPDWAPEIKTQFAELAA